jgi:hypothetical protein
MVMEKCIGMMEAFIKGSGRMGYSMGKEQSQFQAKEWKKGYLRIMC